MSSDASRPAKSPIPAFIPLFVMSLMFSYFWRLLLSIALEWHSHWTQLDTFPTESDGLNWAWSIGILDRPSKLTDWWFCFVRKMYKENFLLVGLGVDYFFWFLCIWPKSWNKRNLRTSKQFAANFSQVHVVNTILLVESGPLFNANRSSGFPLKFTINWGPSSHNTMISLGIMEM